MVKITTIQECYDALEKLYDDFKEQERKYTKKTEEALNKSPVNHKAYIEYSSIASAYYDSMLRVERILGYIRNGKNELHSCRTVARKPVRKTVLKTKRA